MRITDKKILLGTAVIFTLLNGLFSMGLVIFLAALAPQYYLVPLIPLAVIFLVLFISCIGIYQEKKWGMAIYHSNDPL